MINASFQGDKIKGMLGVEMRATERGQGLPASKVSQTGILPHVYPLEQWENSIGMSEGRILEAQGSSGCSCRGRKKNGVGRLGLALLAPGYRRIHVIWAIRGGHGSRW